MHTTAPFIGVTAMARALYVSAQPTGTQLDRAALVDVLAAVKLRDGGPEGAQQRYFATAFRAAATAPQEHADRMDWALQAVRATRR